MLMPKVSVLVPIYNVSKYLEECLDSIVGQTLTDIEIICINDGSTDNSLEIIEKYAKKDDRIVIINKKNSGYGDSMNQGIAKATGEYIGIVESDDWIDKNMFQKLYSLARRNKAEVVKSNFYNFFTDPKKSHINGTIVNIVNPNETGKVIDTTTSNGIIWQQPCIWSAIYQRDFLNKNNIRFLPSPGASYQDLGFNFKVWINATRACFTTDAFLHYRQDNESSSVNSPGKVFCVADEHKEAVRYLKEHKLYDTFKDVLFSLRWGNYRWNIDRLTPELAKDFIEYASNEYRSLYDSGDFNFLFFDANAAREVRELISNPQMVMDRKLAISRADVSVIIPAYNNEDYIDKCLKSIINQTHQNIEIIIVDDGSIDRTSDIAEEYFKKDARIKIINQVNQGLSASRNTGIDNSKSPFIMFCDSDDFYETNSVDTMLSTIKSTEADLAVGSINILYESRQFTALKKEEDRQYYAVKFRGKHNITSKLLNDIDVSSWNKIFKRSIIEQSGIRYPLGLWYEDAYFFYAYTWSSQTISFAPVDKPVYNYIRRNGSIMDKTFKKHPKACDHIEISFKLFDFLKEKKLFSKQSRDFGVLFANNLVLALCNVPDETIPHIISRLQEFYDKNHRYIASFDRDVDLLIRRSIDALQPPEIQEEQHPNEESLSLRIKNETKRLLRPLLLRSSPGFRAAQNAVRSLDSIHAKLGGAEPQNKPITNDLANAISKIEAQVRKITNK